MHFNVVGLVLHDDVDRSTHGPMLRRVAIASQDIGARKAPKKTNRRDFQIFLPYGDWIFTARSEARVLLDTRNTRSRTTGPLPCT